MLSAYAVVAAVIVQLGVVNGNIVPARLPIGTVSGHSTTVTKGKAIYNVVEFLGIPYAEPPVDGLRFTKPKPLHMVRDDPYNATFYRPFCPQVMEFLGANGVEDENCLYLNVFVPGPSLSQTSDLAVMVWVHGGGFQSGASNEYHGAFLAASGNVIVVTINYRLGVFGFLSTGDDNASGNYGLYDQAMAFQWVHDNIHVFGGDNNRVTLFGESAGAMSVCVQGLYPDNHGRFQRIIAESGSALTNDLSVSNNPLPFAQSLAGHLDCESQDPKEMVDCLRQVSWETIKDKMRELSNDPNMAALVEFNPTADDSILKTSPKQLRAMTSDYVPEEVTFFRSLDFFSGFNAYESGLFMAYLTNGVPVNEFQPTYDDMMTNHLDMVFYFQFGRSFPDDLKRTLLHEYTNWSDPFNYESIRLQFAKAISDLSFAIPAVNNAMLHLDDTDSGKTYMYHFIPATNIRSPITPEWLAGADHMEEIAFVFGQKYDKMTDWERQLSDRMITYWSNFAKSGLVIFHLYSPELTLTFKGLEIEN